MNDYASEGLVAVVSPLVLEALKWLYRKAFNKPGYDFPAWVYVLTLAVLNYVLVPVFAYFGFEGYVMPTDLAGWVRDFVVLVVQTIASFAAYTLGVKPVKDYHKALAEEKAVG